MGVSSDPKDTNTFAGSDVCSVSKYDPHAEQKYRVDCSVGEYLDRLCSCFDQAKWLR